MTLNLSFTVPKMFVSILCSALVVVCSAIAITLPNGFTIDEKLLFKIEPRDSTAERCERPHEGCSNDCSTQMTCDGNYNVVEPTYTCLVSTPYCVKNVGSYSMCSANFPMNNPACVTKAVNNLICSGDGHFPDPTDCTKYHVCNGTAHSIVECAASSQFSSDPNFQNPYMDPGDGTFICRFRREVDACMCNKFYCDGMPNTFVFRPMDTVHYAYCLEIAPLKKVVMFKCPSGTRHNGMVSSTNSVDCVPNGTPFS